MKFITAIASTSHIDRYGDIVTKEALYGIAEQINNKYIPHLIEHDRNKHIGVILYGEVFQLYDGEFALGIVAGIFEQENEKKLFKSGEKNITKEEFKEYLNIDDLKNMNKNNVSNKPNIETNNESDKIFNRLNSYKLLPNGEICQVKHLVNRWNGYKIYMYKENNHFLPHIHIEKKGEMKASYSLERCDKLAGDDFKQKNDAKIFKRWLEDNKVTLIKMWNDLAEGSFISTDNYLFEKIK